MWIWRCEDFIIIDIFIVFQVVKAFFYIFGVIYLIYLFILILRAYTELRSIPFFGMY